MVGLRVDLAIPGSVWKPHVASNSGQLPIVGLLAIELKEVVTMDCLTYPFGDLWLFRSVGIDQIRRHVVKNVALEKQLMQVGVVLNLGRFPVLV